MPSAVTMSSYKLLVADLICNSATKSLAECLAEGVLASCWQLSTKRKVHYLPLNMLSM